MNTPKGAKQASLTMRQLYGDDYYRVIGKLGGYKSRGGGFASEYVDTNGLTGPDRARIAGKKGGEKSRRGKAHA